MVAPIDPFDPEVRGLIRFYSDYGNSRITVELAGDSHIDRVVEAVQAFLLATGYSESSVKEAFNKD